jgi:hypothetical protein
MPVHSLVGARQKKETALLLLSTLENKRQVLTAEGAVAARAVLARPSNPEGETVADRPAS